MITILKLSEGYYKGGRCVQYTRQRNQRTDQRLRGSVARAETDSGSRDLTLTHSTCRFISLSFRTCAPRSTMRLSEHGERLIAYREAKRLRPASIDSLFL